MAETREIKMNYAEGSKEERFAALMEKYVGKTTYIQHLDDEGGNKITSHREYITNEYGGTNSMSMSNGVITFKKRDARGGVKEAIVKPIDEFEA